MVDYIVGAISLASLILNYVLYRRITARYPIGHLEQLEYTPIHYCCNEAESGTEPEEAPKLSLVTTPMVQEIYSPWQNQKNIPWVSPTNAPEPIKLIKRGPLERPDGFI